MNITEKLAAALRAFDTLATSRTAYLGGLSDEMQAVHDQAREVLAEYDTTPNDATRPACWASANVIPLRGLADNYPCVLTATECAANTVALYTAADYDKLREEVERLRADRDSWMNQASARVMDWEQQYRRAEAAEARVARVQSLADRLSLSGPGPDDEDRTKDECADLIRTALNAQGESNGIADESRENEPCEGCWNPGCNGECIGDWGG